MRLAIPSTFPPFRGGISQFNESLKSALESAGHEVIVVNWSRQYPNLLFPGKDQRDPELKRSYAERLDSLSPSTWKRVGKELADAQLDVVLVPFWHAALSPALVGVIRSMRKSSTGTPPRVIGLVHNAGSHDAAWWDARLTGRFLGQLDAAWTLSEEVAERLHELSPDLEVHSLFHPLYDHFPDLEPSAEAKQKLHLPESARVLLYFGLIRPYKGLEVLIEAFASMPSSEEAPVHLLVAGECYGDWRPYQRMIDESPAHDRIQTHERFISDQEVGLFFGAADAVVLPYRRASQSGVTAVALHYGKPIVASDVGGLAEYIQAGQTGELTFPNDPTQLVAALKRALNTHYPEAAFAAARKRFSWDAFVAKALPDSY